MGSGLATVIQDVLVVATSLFKSIRKNRQTVEGSVVVDGLGHLPHCAVVPRQQRRGEAYRAEKERAEDAAEEVGLDSFLGCTARRESAVGTRSIGVSNASES
jgi:hypothetical protein